MIVQSFVSQSALLKVMVLYVQVTSFFLMFAMTGWSPDTYKPSLEPTTCKTSWLKQ